MDGLVARRRAASRASARRAAWSGCTDLPRSGLNLEVKPYGLVGLSQQPRAAGTARWNAHDKPTSGLDAKWEVRPGLVLDGTIHPDFAQVEADDEQVNLTRFDLFFPEKRDFFLENAGIFDFGWRGLDETPPFLLFFSRRIGIAKDDESLIPVHGRRAPLRPHGPADGRLPGRVHRLRRRAALRELRRPAREA